MIHGDVWGPNRTSTLSNKKSFITFMYDNTRLCWVYLLKEKSEVVQIIKKIVNWFRFNLRPKYKCLEPTMVLNFLIKLLEFFS